MALIPLIEVQTQIKCGEPLLWDVLNERSQLLLAKGQCIATETALTALLERATYVNADDVLLLASVDCIGTSFFEQWHQHEACLGLLLKNFNGTIALDKLKQASHSLNVLVDQDSDQAIFSVMRHDHSRYAAYGITHSLHVAAVCSLLAEKMGWTPERRASLVGAALTMNLSIIELQGVLAARGGPLNQSQKALIKSHPDDSARILEEAGLSDQEWLSAIRDHHEAPDGRGYPLGKSTPNELSQLIRMADIFTAKHASRSNRQPIPPRQAAQELYKVHQKQPSASLLIKEFGVYPPGCFVKLNNGELAVSLRKGASALTPLVAVLQESQQAPVYRDTSNPKFAVSAVIPDRDVMIRLNSAQLFAPLLNGQLPDSICTPGLKTQ